MHLPPLSGRQRHVVALPSYGHVVVLGTAGSGKSTMAVHRAAYLANPATDHAGNTLLVTFNQSLITYLRYLRGSAMTNIISENYHKFATGYLRSQGLIGNYSVCSPQQRNRMISSVLNEMKKEDHEFSILGFSDQFISDEISWLDRNGFSEIGPYQESLLNRIDTHYRNLDIEKFAKSIMLLREAYRRRRADSGKTFDWFDIATSVKNALIADRSLRRYRHVVIDEAQDFSPEMIRSLAQAIPEDGSLTIFSDAAQQIYGSQITWRSAGLLVNDKTIWYFKDNYRNTSQIARLALAISRMPFYQGVTDLVEPVSPTADGPLPVLVQFHSKQEEVKFVIRTAERLGRTQSVAVLLRHREDEGLVSASLPPDSIRLHRDMRHWPAGPGVRYGTYHASKGLEFDTVLLPLLSKDHLPAADLVASVGQAEAMARDGRLVYVGVTRARVGLIMSHCGVVTPLLPRAGNLYRREVG